MNRLSHLDEGEETLADLPKRDFETETELRAFGKYESLSDDGQLLVDEMDEYYEYSSGISRNAMNEDLERFKAEIEGPRFITKPDDLTNLMSAWNKLRVMLNAFPASDETIH